MRVRRSTFARCATAGLAVPLVVLALSGATTPSPASPPAAEVAQKAPNAKTPTRVVMIVLDQLRPEFIDAFDMDNVKALMASGANFENAYLGHMASETVISHNVMTSGMLPKHMGWSDEWYRDVDGVLGAPNDMYVTGSMSAPQFDLLINHRGYQKLPDYLHETFPGTTVAAIGQKSYATNTMGGPSADMRITYSGRNFDCDGDGVNSWRGPAGPTGSEDPQVPTYLAEECGRFYIDSDRAHTYGTGTTPPADMYPLEGNRDVRGNDPDHYGGDRWTTDAALRVMRNEDWSGLLLTLGGIDKAGHMWGGLNDVRPYEGDAEASTHMAALARVADAQVGRIMDRLEALGLKDETLIVLTTDHAQLTAENYFGLPGAGRGNFNWYYGADADETYLTPSPEIMKLITGLGGTGATAATDGNMRASMQDSAIRTWLDVTTAEAKKQAADVMATLGGVRASFYRAGNHYKLHWQAPRSQWGDSEWQWYKRHGQEIVNTEAAPYGPDVIGLLANNTSYGVAGDHGGAQQSVQEIPIVFSGPGIKPGSTPNEAIRSVDILPTLLRAMNIPREDMDGRAYSLP